jgi:hypothetical protein
MSDLPDHDQVKRHIFGLSAHALKVMRLDIRKVGGGAGFKIQFAQAVVSQVSSAAADKTWASSVREETLAIAPSADFRPNNLGRALRWTQRNDE